MKYLLPASILSVLSGASQAAVYSSNFDSAPYNYGDNLNGVDGWTVSAGALPVNPAVAVILNSPFPSPVSGGQALHLGFQEFGASSAYVYRSDGSGLVGNTLGYTEFQAAFYVNDSVPPFTKRDGFSFTFRGSGNENLLTVSLAPTAQSGSPQLNPLRIDQFSYTSDFAAGNTNIGSLTEGQWSTLNVKFTPSGASDVAFSIKFQGVQFASGILAGAASQNLGTYGFVWTPNDPSNEGSNVLVLDDVYLIPEPSSTLLLGVAGLGLALRRRRA